MAYAVILIAIAACAIGAYLLLVFREVPGAIEERLGEYEALPEDLGEWREAPSDSTLGRTASATEAGPGEICEVRLLHQQGGTFSRPKLIRQVRYRDAETRKILRVEPDEELKRRRVKR
ncbi:MAG: hypothetical protein KIT72_02595 [Polyangiaceae bacterium]|nr:hypothetical protein [Polyangiaceae bacterium]MCW5789288.1 hypothetical protein [Polyangiaceae bacterium]